jgi:hypothetical protein
VSGSFVMIGPLFRTVTIRPKEIGRIILSKGDAEMKNVIKGIVVGVVVAVFATVLAPSAALCDGDPSKLPPGSGYLVPPTPPGGSSWGKSAQQSEDERLQSGAKKKSSPSVTWIGAGKPRSVIDRGHRNPGKVRLAPRTMIPPHRR